MKKFQIENTKSSVILGVYEAETKDQALDMMAQDAGYASYADLQDEVPENDLLVTEALICFHVSLIE